MGCKKIDDVEKRRNFRKRIFVECSTDQVMPDRAEKKVTKFRSLVVTGNLVKLSCAIVANFYLAVMIMEEVGALPNFETLQMMKFATALNFPQNLTF